MGILSSSGKITQNADSNFPVAHPHSSGRWCRDGDLCNHCQFDRLRHREAELGSESFLNPATLAGGSFMGNLCRDAAANSRVEVRRPKLSAQQVLNMQSRATFFRGGDSNCVGGGAGFGWPKVLRGNMGRKFFAVIAVAAGWLTLSAEAIAQQPGYVDFGPTPASLNLPAGALVTIQVTQLLSSDRNHPGDGFTAVLAQPLVASGWVVSRMGQTVIGRISTVQKSDHLLGIELNEVILVDGQQAPIRTELLQYSVRGAHDHAILPGARITFRLQAPLTLFTGQSAPAFQPVTQQDYDDRGVISQAPQGYSTPTPVYPVERPYYAPYYPGRTYFGFYGGYRFGPRIYLAPRWGWHGGFRPRPPPRPSLRGKEGFSQRNR